MNQFKLPLAILFGVLTAYLLRDSFVGLSWVIFLAALIVCHFVFLKIPLYRIKLVKLIIFLGLMISVLIYGKESSLLLGIIAFLALIADSSPRITAYFTDVVLSFGQMFKGIPDYLRLPKSLSSRPSFKSVILFAIPFGLILVFLSFYTSGNQFFGNAVNSSFTLFNDWLEEVFAVLDFQWWVLFVFGVVLLGGAIHRIEPGILIKTLDGFPLKLQRSKRVKKDWQTNSVFNLSNMSLKNEKNLGVVVLISLNSLLFLANLFDFINLWTGIEESAVNYSRFVHQGTSHLVIAIILAALVIVFYFRGNLNFYKENKLLKKLAYIWIGQNVLLALNVALRNLHYVWHTNALTDKRISVFIFLALVVLGLSTLILKVYKKKTIPWLLKINAFSIVVALSICQMVNWERVMISYNFSNPNSEHIDMEQLFREVDYDLVYLDNRIKNTEGLNYYFRGENDAYKRWNSIKSHYWRTYNESSIKFWTWCKQKNLEKLQFEDEIYSEKHTYN